jgi:hypothetical protein
MLRCERGQASVELIAGGVLSPDTRHHDASQDERTMGTGRYAWSLVVSIVLASCLSLVVGCGYGGPLRHLDTARAEGLAL